MGIPEDFPLWNFGHRIVQKIMRRLFFGLFFFFLLFLHRKER